MKWKRSRCGNRREMRNTEWRRRTTRKQDTKRACGTTVRSTINLKMRKHKSKHAKLSIFITIIFTSNNYVLRSALFWDITQRRVLNLYRRFGTTYRSHLQVSRSKRRKLYSRTSWPVKMRQIGCPETSAQNYHSSLRNIPDKLRPHLHGGRILKSHITMYCLQIRKPTLC